MPAIKGFGSGMSQIVDQIMVAEREPIKTMEAKKQKLETKLTLVGDIEGRLGKIKTSLKDLIGMKKFTDYSLSISDPDVLGGAVEAENVSTGNWKIEVDKLAESAGALTNTVPDKDKTHLGVGYFRFNTPEGSRDVYINNNNNTLEGIARTINFAEMGVTATIAPDGSDGEDAYRLIISSEHYGNNHNVEFPTIYLLDGDQDFYLDKERASKNGQVKVNGFPVEIINNKLENVIPGVTLDLKSAKPGKEVQIGVVENHEALENKLKSFVEAANGALSFVQQQTQMNEKTDTSKTLGGDSMIRALQQRLRQLIQSTSTDAQGSITRLSQLGVEFNRAGTLDFKEDKFMKAIKSQPKDVLSFFRGDGSMNGGFIGKTKLAIDSMLSSQFGLVSNKKKGLQNQVSQIDRTIETKEKHLVAKEDQLRKKFGRLEEQMAKINAQGAQLGAMGMGGGNAVSQLIG